MRAARFQPTFHQGDVFVRAEPIHDAHTGDRMSAAIEQNRLTLAIGFMPRQTGGDFHNIARFEIDPFDPAHARIIGIWHTITHCAVIAFDGVTFELFSQPVMRAVVFGDNQQTAGVFVNAMDDAWPPFTTNT